MVVTKCILSVWPQLIFFKSYRFLIISQNQVWASQGEVDDLTVPSPFGGLHDDLGHLPLAERRPHPPVNIHQCLQGDRPQFLGSETSIQAGAGYSIEGSHD